MCKTTVVSVLMRLYDESMMNYMMKINHIEKI